MKNRLREAREHYNKRHPNYPLTQAELARRAGVARETVVQLEKGATVPKVDLAIRLKRILNVRSVEVLFIEPRE